MSNNETKYGFYSQKAVDSGSDAYVYKGPNGEDVFVTCVGTDPEALNYLWDDKQSVGEVTSFVRQIKNSKKPFKEEFHKATFEKVSSPVDILDIRSGKS